MQISRPAPPRPHCRRPALTAGPACWSAHHSPLGCNVLFCVLSAPLPAAVTHIDLCSVCRGRSCTELCGAGGTCRQGRHCRTAETAGTAADTINTSVSVQSEAH